MKLQAQVKESDWKLFRSKMPGWQEAYMNRLNQEYISLLSAPGNPADKFCFNAKTWGLGDF